MEGINFPKVSGKYAFKSMVLPKVYHRHIIKGAAKPRNAVFIYGSFILKFLRKK